MPDRKPPIVSDKSKPEIQEPIKSYAVSNKAPAEIEKPDQKPDVVLEKSYRKNRTKRSRNP